MLIVFFRALILYAVVFLVIRLMGKRELSKVQPFELAIIILIADLASAPRSARGMSIFDGIVPIITLLIMYIVFTLIIKTNTKVQDVVCGSISVIIENGKIVEEEFNKLEYTIPDLMSQLRENNVFKIQDVKYAILETNGNLDVITYNDSIESLPLNVVEDGCMVKNNITILKMKEEDIERLIYKNKLKLEEILVATIDEKGNFIYQLKKSKLKEVKR